MPWRERFGLDWETRVVEELPDRESMLASLEQIRASLPADPFMHPEGQGNGSMVGGYSSYVVPRTPTKDLQAVTEAIMEYS